MHYLNYAAWVCLLMIGKGLHGSDKITDWQEVLLKNNRDKNYRYFVKKNKLAKHEMRQIDTIIKTHDLEDKGNCVANTDVICLCISRNSFNELNALLNILPEGPTTE